MSLVYNTNISKTEYLVDLEDNGKAKQTALLSMSSTAPSGTFQKGSKYFNSTDKKIYTAVEDNVWGTTGKDPNFGIIYQCNNDYYVWDGDNLITTDLEGYEKLVNKATNFNTLNNTKYPTTKAVADYVVKESIVRNFTDAGITKTTSSDVFSDRTNNTGLAEEILAKQFPTGTTLYGEVRNQGMPTGIGNAEIRVEILETKSNGAQVIEFTLFSVDIEPKEWSHIYFSARTEQQNPWVWVPKAVPTDDYTSNATTTVPTSKALNDGLLLKQDISNKSDDYTEDSSIKYPSSKALSDGLKSVEPNLYDIRTLSQAIANKGWTYLCNSTKQMLPKAKIPTAYDDIEQKYLSADKELSAFQKLNSGHNDTAYKYFYNDTTQKYYYLSSNNPYKIYSSNTPNLATTTLEYTGDDGCSCWCAGNNIIIVARYCRRVDNMRYFDFDIFDKNLTFLRQITITGPNQSGNTSNVNRIWFRRDTFIISIDGSYGDNDSYQWVILLKDNVNITGGNFYKDFFGYTWRNSDVFQSDRCPLTNIINDKYVYMITGSRSDNRRIYKLDLDTYELTLCGQRPNGTLYTNLCYYNNKFYIGIHISYHLRFYESSDCSSWTEIRMFDDESIGCIINLGSFCLCFGDYNVYSTTDFNTFTVYESNISTYSSLHGYFTNYIQSDDYFFVLCNLSTSGTIPYNFFGSSLIPKVYTDTYTINGSTVNIQYYKNEDWKICIAGENGTDDINLDAVYNVLGYENYLLLDRNNQQLCLPRNSNLYTQMYVGDDYEDITTPSGNSTRLLPQSNLITDMTSTSITFDSTNKVQPNTDYEYGELTTLTLDSSSIISSKLGTTIKFQSGTTATTIIDSSNIQWADRAKPEPSASKTCLIFIWDNTGFYKEW